MKMNVSKTFSSVAALAFVFGLTVMPVQADIVFGTGSGGNQATDNILFNVNGLINDALTVQGISNTTPRFLVDFTSTLTPLHSDGGAATIKALAPETFFSDLTINLNNENAFFTKAIFNLDASTNGTATISARNSDGIITSKNFALGANGSNFFNVVAINGQLIDWIHIVSSTEIALRISDAEQIRLGGIQVVPEPGFYGVLVLGMSGLSWFAFRRKQLAS